MAFRSDSTARVTIRRSKTDQEGAGAIQYVAPLATKALRAIMPASADPAARVFGLTDRTISNRLAAMAKAAEFEGDFSGRSARVGMCRDLVAHGAGLAAVQVAGRGVSARTPSYYARAEIAGRGAVARYYEQTR